MTGFQLLKLLSVVCGFGWQTYDSRNNICQQTFCFQRFVDNAQKCFAFTPQANFARNHLMFILSLNKIVVESGYYQELDKSRQFTSRMEKRKTYSVFDY